MRRPALGESKAAPGSRKERTLRTVTDGFLHPTERSDAKIDTMNCSLLVQLHQATERSSIEPDWRSVMTSGLVL